MTELYEGACLCGAITLNTELEHTHYHICHCDSCRTWNSGPQFAVSAGTNVHWKGEEYIRAYSSSDWAERGFCNKCGTHLFYRVKADGSYYLSMGILKDSSKFTLEAQLCIDNKPEHYALTNDCAMVTEAQLHAMFADA